MTLNDTPRGNRTHIGIFGRRNAGKSSLINALTGQKLAIVSQTPGTTADPVFKSMELHPVGPVVFIDTAGFDDEGELGELRVSKTAETIKQTDVAVLVLDGPELAGCARLEYIDEMPENRRESIPSGTPVLSGLLALEQQWMEKLQAAKIPAIVVVNKWDQINEAGRRAVREMVQEFTDQQAEDDAAYGHSSHADDA